jgi:hypothetical protein
MREPGVRCGVGFGAGDLGVFARSDKHVETAAAALGGLS